MSSVESSEEALGFLLWQVSSKWRRNIEQALTILELTHPQFVLLAGIGWLTRDGAEVTQIELARHCAMDIAMTSQILRTLEKGGSIKRKQHIEDKRAKSPQLTSKGIRLVERAIPLVEGIDNAFFGVLKQDIKVCMKILQKLGRMAIPSSD